MTTAPRAADRPWLPAALRRRAGGRSFRAVIGTAGVNMGSTLLTSIGGILLARSLGANDRGEFVAVLQWPATLGSLASLGITQSTCFWISRRRDEGAAITAIAARAAVLTGVVVAVLGLGLAPVIGRTDTATALLRIVFALSPVFVVGGVWISSLQAVDIATWNRARAFQPVTYFSAVLGLSVFQRLTLTTATLAFCCSLLVQAAFARHQSRRNVIGREPSPPGTLRTLYRYGVRVWASAVPQAINVRVDQLALSVMPAVASSQLGVYAVAASLSWLALPAATAFGAVAFPAVAASTDEGTIRRIERLSLLGSAAAAAAALGVACVAAPFAIPLLFGSDFQGAVTVLWLLAPGTVFLAMNRVLADLLQGRGRPLLTSVGEGSAAVLTVVMLFVLIPRFGIRGAAAASSVAYLGATVILYFGLRSARPHPPFQPSGPGRA